MIGSNKTEIYKGSYWSDYEKLHTVATHAWSALVQVQRFTDTQDIDDPYFNSLHDRIERALKELEAYGCHE